MEDERLIIKVGGRRRELRNGGRREALDTHGVAGRRSEGPGHARTGVSACFKKGDKVLASVGNGRLCGEITATTVDDDCGGHVY